MEVPVPAGWGRAELILPQEVVEEYFPQAGEFLEAVPMRGVTDGEIEEFQRAIEGLGAEGGVSLRRPAERPLDLAPHVGQLLHQRELLPSAGSQLPVVRAHGLRSASTIRRIRRRMSGSSTERERLP